MLFHRKLSVRPTLTVSLFAFFGRKGFGGHAIEMVVHGLSTPGAGIGSTMRFRCYANHCSTSKIQKSVPVFIHAAAGHGEVGATGITGFTSVTPEM